MTTAFVSHPTFLLHEMGPYHPECPERICAITDRLIASGLDAYLLPGQIIPEHWHVKVGTIPEKMEVWLVRSGEVYTYAEGAPTPNMKAKLTAADAANITVKNEHILGVGEVAGISHPLEKHWMQAGPQGAIFTEFSTFHTGEAVKFTDPKIKF